MNYSQLAEKFLEEDQIQAAAYFYRKCMRLAKESSVSLIILTRALILVSLRILHGNLKRQWGSVDVITD